MRLAVTFAVLAATCPATALAQEPTGEKSAATSLRHQLRTDPDDRAVMVNLAREYLKAGRAAKAQRLYRQLLGMDDVALDRVGGPPVSSHWLAAEALRQSAAAPPVRMSSRR